MSFLETSIAIALAGVISIISVRARVLDLSGGIAAFLLGTIVFSIGGLSASIVLILFFIVGSALTRLPRKNHLRPTDDSSQLSRNWKQVLANGWIPGVTMLTLYLKPELREETTVVFLGAIATAAADTFATEIGTRYSKRTVSLATFRPIQNGLSGGVSFIGTLASVVGALTIAVGFYFSRSLGNLCEFAGINWFLPILAAGFLGAMIDSWLGATIQVKYRCGTCGSITEARTHCGNVSERISGITWIDNNVVNAISILMGGLLYLSLLG